jgi:hypothetical protein
LAADNRVVALKRYFTFRLPFGISSTATDKKEPSREDTSQAPISTGRGLIRGRFLAGQSLFCTDFYNIERQQSCI